MKQIRARRPRMRLRATRSERAIAVLHAQDGTLTVTVPSADVHKGPSTVTPVIGHVSRGAALPVSRSESAIVPVLSRVRRVALQFAGE